MIHAPGPRRERILVYGQEGSGKSFVWLMIAEWIYKTKSKAKVWLVDTDRSWDAMRPIDGHLDDIVRIFDIHEWSDYGPAIKTIRTNGAPDDWFSIDLVDNVWDDSQQGYTEAVFGQDLGAFYLEQRVKDLPVGGDYGTNWQHIKKMYRDVTGLITRFPGHVICCATAAQVTPKKGNFGDDPDVVEKYGRVGWKPNGEKKIGHLFHTVIYMADAPSGYLMTSTKDRQRERFNGKKVTPDFVVSYLIGVAGWKP